MADTHTAEVRSRNMSRVKGKDTGLEMLVRKHLFSHGFRYRLHSKHLPGKPDLVFPGFKTALFVHGCFWHGHKGCRYATIPQTRTEWWQAKITRNRSNDHKVVEALESLGWQVLVVWGCDLKPRMRGQRLASLVEEVNSAREQWERRNRQMI